MMLLSLLIILHILFYVCFPTFKKAQKAQCFSQMILLGCPCLPDGSLSDVQLRRIHAAVYYYKSTHISMIVISGGSVKNKHMEAQVMANELQKQLPKAHIEVEAKAKNTYQNMKYVSTLFPSDNILIISGSSHLRRSYFFARKFYTQITMGYGKEKDPWHFYLREYFRMWNALYWEIRLRLLKK